MNALLLKSLKITFETTDISLHDLALQQGMSEQDLEEHSRHIGIPTSEWVKIATPPVPIVQGDILPPAEDTEAPKDTLRSDLDDAYKTIVTEAKTLLNDSFEMTPKDLKDIAAVLKTVEDVKYPRSASQGMELDLSEGIIRMFQTIGDDI